MNAQEIFTTERLAAAGGARIVSLPKGRITFSQVIHLGAEWSNCTFRGSKTIFDGGTPISFSSAGRFWTAPLPEGHRYLYRNGDMVVNCRWPASGTVKCARWESKKDAEKNVWEKNRLHCELSEEIRQNMDGADLVMYYGWLCNHQREFKTDERGIDLFFQPRMICSGDCSFAIEDLPESFLQPGQWHPDPVKGILYYCPKEDEKRGDAEFFSSGTDRLLIVDGAENITFENITFRHTGDPVKYLVCQADHLASAAVELKNCKDCNFRDCRFEALSNWGLYLSGGSVDNTVMDCNFTNLGSGALHIAGELNGPYCGRNQVRNCRMSHGGLVQANCAALLIRLAGENVIENNEISDFPYSGISCGWIWGYRMSSAFGNRIIGNTVHDLGKDHLVCDMGGIYLLGDQPGTIVANNHIYNIQGDQFCWGIYLDEGSSHITVSGNLVHNCAKAPFRVHYGHRNLVTGNLFAASKTGAVCAFTRGTMDFKNYYLPGDKVFDFSGNLCIANGMPFYLKYILEQPVKQSMTDAWCGNNNFCIQLDPECKTKFCDDFHCFKNTYTAIPDEIFLAPDRDDNSVFRTGSLPPPEEIPIHVRALYEKYLKTLK